MFLKQSVVLVAIAFLLVEADSSGVSKLTRRNIDLEKHDNHDGNHAGSLNIKFHSKDSESSAHGGSIGLGGGHGGGIGLRPLPGGIGGGMGGGAGRVVGGGIGGGSQGGSGGCSCGQFKEIMNKIMLLLKAYGSEELLPDLQALGAKTAHYFLTYLAKEKPDELNKFHGFLTTTTKMTGNFVGGPGNAGGAPGGGLPHGFAGGPGQGIGGGRPGGFGGGMAAGVGGGLPNGIAGNIG